MKNLIAPCGLAAAIVFAVFSLAPRCSAQAAPQSTAQNAAPAAQKPTPRAPDGHPDLSGFYNLVDIYKGDPVAEKPGQHVVEKTADGSVFFDYGGSNQGDPGARVTQTQNGKVNLLDRTCASCENPPYKPEYMAKARAIGAAMNGDASPVDPQYDCIPYGIPRGSVRGGGDYAMQIVQNSQVVAFLYEDRPGPYFRIVYLNGQHPDDLDNSYFGHSIGHWEGDTLVVDVVGLSDDTWLGSGTVGPKLAMMHSDQLHVVERWTRTGDVLTWEATVYDPVMFTKAWVMTPRQTQIAASDDYIRPTMCVPFDKSHIVKSDNSLYSSAKPTSESAPPSAAPASVGKMAGSWSVQIFSTTEGIIAQRWSIQQNAATVTGTVAAKNGDLPLSGTMDGATLHGTITDGQNKYELHGSVVQNDFDGTIKMGRNEWRLSAKRSQ